MTSELKKGKFQIDVKQGRTMDDVKNVFDIADETIIGTAITVRVVMPNGEEHDIPAKTGLPIVFLKECLAKNTGLTVPQITLFHEDKELYDVLSICDVPGLHPDKFNKVRAEVVSQS